MRRKLADPSFIIPVRNDDIAYADAPPEFLRAHIIKTELAKTVSGLLFGDESAYIRFDMSEFSDAGRQPVSNPCARLASETLHKLGHAGHSLAWHSTPIADLPHAVQQMLMLVDLDGIGS